MKNKSFFTKILKYFLVTLILPFLTFILLYAYAERTIEDQIVLSSERVLTQFFALVDNVMGDVSQTCISVGSEKACSQHINDYMQDAGNNKYSAIKVQHMLRDGYREDRFFDVLVYYPAMDQVLSQRNGSLSTKDYLISTYGREDYQQEQYSPLLDCDSPKPRISSFVGGDQQTYLCMSMRWFSVGYTDREYIVSIVFSPEFLASLMIQEHLGDDGTLMIFDAQKELLLSGDGVTSYSFPNSDGNNKLFEFEGEDGNYMMLSKNSGVVEGYYAYATNTEDFWQALSVLRMVGVITCSLCLVLTVVLVFRGTRKVYSPIGMALHRAEQMGVESYDRNEHNEIDFISRILEKSNVERTNLQKQVKKSQNLQHDQFVRSLLKGEFDEKNADMGLVDKIGLKYLTGPFRVVLIFVRKSVDMDGSTLDFVIRNTFEEVSSTKGSGYVVGLEANQYALLINYAPDADLEEEMSNLRACQSYLREQLELDMILSSGRVHQGLADVYKSCAEAELAMKYKYLLEDVDYIDHKDITNREFSYTSSMESTLSRNIIGFINGRESELSGRDFVFGIMEKCHINSAASMDNIECFKYEMISIINKAFMISGFSENRKEKIQELIMQPTLEKFQYELANLLELLRDIKQHESKQGRICQKAVEYVEENYGDPQFSVTQLGDMLNLSPYYVSKLLKEKYDMTVPEFIAKTRIQKAKEMLRNTDKSIKDVAEECGFLSSNVFIRVFKRREGVTPGIYRVQKK